MSKREQIRQLLASGTKRTRIAEVVGCSYQQVRNVEQMVDTMNVPDTCGLPGDEDFHINCPSRRFGLIEETPIRLL